MEDDDYHDEPRRQGPAGKRKRAAEDEMDDEAAAYLSGEVADQDLDEMAVDDLDVGDLGELDDEMIEKLVNEAPEMDALDSSSIKKLIANFEKALTKNQQMRSKFFDQPEKFMESEYELDQEIKHLQALATTPNLYPDLIRLKSHLSLMNLLSHENTDVAIDVIEVLKELTDGTPLEESPEEVTALVDEFLANQCLQLLVQNMRRLNEKVPEEKAGIYHSLSVVENFLEARMQETISVLLKETDLIQWLVNRIKPREFEEMKGYSAELLAILSQNSKEVQLLVGKLGGIDILLTALNFYKKTNPGSLDEEEMIENVIDCACVVCALPEHQAKFTEAEGLQLIQLLIKNKKFCRSGALKMLDHVLQNSEENCHVWVDIGGLSVLFGAFMRKGAGKHKKGYDEKADDEHCVSALVSLLSKLSSNSPLYTRVLAKFQESNYEKVERLVELHQKYLSQVLAAENKIDRERQQLEEEGIEIGDAEENEFYLSKLDAGLFTLQLTDRIIATICCADPKIKETLFKLLDLQNLTVESVKVVLRDHASSLGDEDDEDAAVKEERQKILDLADNL